MISLYSLEEVAEKIGKPFSEYTNKYKRKAITDLIRDKNIECVKLGRTIKLNEYQLAKFMDAYTCQLNLSKSKTQKTGTAGERTAERAYSRALDLAKGALPTRTGSGSKTKYRQRMPTGQGMQ